MVGPTIRLTVGTAAGVTEGWEAGRNVMTSSYDSKEMRSGRGSGRGLVVSCRRQLTVLGGWPGGSRKTGKGKHTRRTEWEGGWGRKAAGKGTKERGGV
jgi:hypothetical protein